MATTRKNEVIFCINQYRIFILFFLIRNGMMMMMMIMIDTVCEKPMERIGD